MPPKNVIELGSGTLYFYPPEGGDPVPVGPVKSVEITHDIYEERDDTGRFIGPLRKTCATEATIEVVNAVWPLIKQVANTVSTCSRWAVNNRPRLCHLALHAKKRRARKKNVRRIILEFVKEG